MVYCFQPNWEATPLSIGGTTTNPSAMDMNLRIERISRSEFGFSGTFFWNIDVDDSVMVISVPNIIDSKALKNQILISGRDAYSEQLLR